MHVHKAYLNATGKIATYTLTHDVKRAILDAKAAAGHVCILSTQATTAVLLLENDDTIKKELMAHVQKMFESVSSKPISRRSGSGPDRFHLMAAFMGLTITLPFQQGRLLGHPQHEVLALDFEPKAGRREFIVSVLPSGGGAAPAGGGPPMPGR